MGILKTLKDLVRDSAVDRLARKWRDVRDYRRWVRSGSPAPPPHLVKQKVIRKYADQHRCQVLVETGTFCGDMLQAMKNRFRELYSIELQRSFHERARQRFAETPHIHLFQGDSGERIRDVLNELEEPVVFWLDGHYSAGETARGDLDTPIERELDHILAHSVKDHVILIDDARLFDGTNDYPTLDSVRARFDSRGNYSMAVENDVIAVSRIAA